MYKFVLIIYRYIYIFSVKIALKKKRILQNHNEINKIKIPHIRKFVS